MEVSPRTLVFPTRDPDVALKFCRNILTLHNTTAQSLLFKMRATNLQRYVCRPNFGVVQPGDTQEIQVLLSYEELDGKVKGDKFEVQWADLAGEDMARAKELLSSSGNRAIIKVKYVPGERLQMNLSSQFSFSESTPPQKKNPLVTEWKPSPSPVANPVRKSPRNKAKAGQPAPKTPDVAVKSASSGPKGPKQAKTVSKSSVSSYMLLMAIVVALFAVILYQFFL